MVDYQQLIDIGLSPDRQTLTRRLVAIAESMDFGLTAGVLIRGRFGSPNALVESLGNPPEAFKKASQTNANAVRDPLLTRHLERPGHMTYDQAFYVDAGATDLWDIQSAFGYRHGLSVSLHAPTHAEVFVFGVDRPDALPSGAERLRLQSLVQMVAMHAQAAMQRLLQTAPQTAHEDLSTKEVDALQSVAATVYARRAGLVGVSQMRSPELQMAMRKLQSQSLSGAVLRAVDGGLIDR